MTIKTLAAGGAAAVAFASLLSAAPALAFTRHPATPEEIQQTDALNAQSLANARMGANANAPTASTNVNATTNSSTDLTAPKAPDAGVSTTTGGTSATTPAPADKPAPLPGGPNGQ